MTHSIAAPIETFFMIAWRRLAAGLRRVAESSDRSGVRYAITPHRLGRVLIAATPHSIWAIAVGPSDDALIINLRKRFPGAKPANGDEAYWSVALDALELLDSVEPKRLPGHLIGITFVHALWSALRRKPSPATSRSSRMSIEQAR